MSKKNILRQILWVILMQIGISSPIFAQFYDTFQRPHLKWHEINTPHFRIIFHDGLEDVAMRSAHILETQYPVLREKIGGSLSSYPVVINGYNDMANGYVTTLHFRMEIEAPPIAGKILNPNAASRLETLLAHELVHALHFSELGSIGFTRFLAVFSPDIARSVHGLSPPGFREGLATHVESDLVPDKSGRGNFAPFTNQFYSNLRGSNRWNLSQMLTPSPVTRPGDRYYIAGYHFTRWLIESNDSTLVPKSLRTFANFPFLGYVPHVWYHTGKSPSTLYREFIQHELHELDQLESVTGGTLDQITVLNTGTHPDKNGHMVYYPHWVDDHTLLYYGSFYNDRSGFFTYDLSESKETAILRTRMDESFRFDISNGSLYWARYRPHLYHDNRYFTDIQHYHIPTRQLRLITKNSRVRQPVITRSSIFALQSRADQHIPVRIDHEEITDLLSPSFDHTEIDFNILDHRVNPVDGRIAVIATVQAKTGIYISESAETYPDFSHPPDVYFDGSMLFDLHWTPDGKYLLFTSDRLRVVHIYAFNPANQVLRQLTTGIENTLEPTVSPDLDRMALVLLRNNLRHLAVMPFNPDLGIVISPIYWKYDHPLTYLDSIEIGKSEFLDSEFDHPQTFIETKENDNDEYTDSGYDRALASDTSNAVEDPFPYTISLDSDPYPIQPYATGIKWLKPRTIVPVSSSLGSDGSQAYGISMHSSDVLRQNAYAFDVHYGRDRIFYDLNYRFSGVFPTTQFRANHTPYNPGNLVSRDGLTFFGEEREYGFSTPIRLHLDHHNSTNQLLLQPEILYRSSRIIVEDSQQPANNHTTEWSGSTRFRWFGVYNYRLRQHLRSVDPVSGLIFYNQTDIDFKTFNSSRRAFKGSRSGIYVYTSPWPSQNHTLRLGLMSVIQNRFGYNTLNMLHDGFNYDGFSLSDKNFQVLSTRYLIPIGHSDSGSILVPAFLERYYLAVFTESIFSGTFDHHESIIGLGIRARVRVFYNLTLDLGIGVSINPVRSGSETIVLNF